ncbi:4Fe-4S binding protein [Anaerotruncus colihominis]
MEPDGVHLNSSQCTGCGLCVQRCPQGLFHLDLF